MTLERGSRLGRFIIRERIGAGGMGTVYRALDTTLQRQVAIKTLSVDKVADRDAIVRFRREALSISALDDPNVVKLIDLVEGEHGSEPPYIVMELLRGQDLYALIRGGSIDIPRVVDIMLQTCAAVGACHRHGFVHRDLKATNIFLTEYNRVETVKILDFGVAKLWGGSRGRHPDAGGEITRNGMVLGTPEYLAPELFAGAAAGPRTDQYALGILLYTALACGRKPFTFEKDSPHPELTLWRAIVKGECLPVRSHRPDVPAGLQGVVERAMNQEPERRFESVHKLGEALLPWASEQSRLLWEIHFTRVPKPPPVDSVDIGQDLVEHAKLIMAQRTVSAPGTRAPGPATYELSSGELARMRRSAVADGDLERTTRAVSHGSMLVGSEGSPSEVPARQSGPAVSRGEDTEGVPTALEAAPTVYVSSAAGASDDASLPAPPRRAWRRGSVVVGSLVGLTSLAAVALGVHRRPPALALRPVPPAEILQGRPMPSAYRTSETPMEPFGPQLSKALLEKTSHSSTPLRRASAKPLRGARRAPRAREVRPEVDANGIWIPSD
jgi:serine/threonine protein kinase